MGAASIVGVVPFFLYLARGHGKMSTIGMLIALGMLASGFYIWFNVD